MQETTDGGFIIAGYTRYFLGLDGLSAKYGSVGYLIKTDIGGNELWSKTFGESGEISVAYSGQETKDGGFIIAGTTNTYGVGTTNSSDIYLIKVGGGTLVTGPIPDVKANGSNGPVIINKGSNLSVTVSLNPGGNGDNADWWVYVTTSFGTYWYTLNSGWQPSNNPIRIYGGPLFNLAPYTVLDMSNLPLGDYTFNFEIDDNMNNVKDGTYTDAVDVGIQ